MYGQSQAAIHTISYLHTKLFFVGTTLRVVRESLHHNADAEFLPEPMRQLCWAESTVEIVLNNSKKKWN